MLTIMQICKTEQTLKLCANLYNLFKLKSKTGRIFSKNKENSIVHTYYFSNAKKRGCQTTTSLQFQSTIAIRQMFYFFLKTTIVASALRLAACSAFVQATPSAHLLVNFVSPKAVTFILDSLIPFLTR